jgi:hypothetical protein
MTGNIYQTELPGRQQPRVARYEASGFIDKDGNRPAPFADRRGDLVDLLGAVRPGVAGVWRQRRVSCGDVSTLIVESVESGATEGAKAPQAKVIPRAQRLLIAMVEQAIGEDETAKMIRPWPDGPTVKAVSDEAVRRRYYARIAENASKN